MELKPSENPHPVQFFKIHLNRIGIDVGLNPRIAIEGPNGAGKSTLCSRSLVFPTEVLKA